MDRHSDLHKGSRVELPASLEWQADMNEADTGLVSGAMLSGAARLLGRIGMLTCALAVVATASLIALRIG
jgi:hypothetical protein